MQRLRDLDRKVLREDRRRTPEQWRRNARRWWWPLAGAVAIVVVELALSLRLDRFGVGPVVFSCLLLAYRSGRLRSEHDRLEGRDPWARVRPLEDRPARG